jgi:hypothetical protein
MSLSRLTGALICMLPCTTAEIAPAVNRRIWQTVLVICRDLWVRHDCVIRKTAVLEKGAGSAD